MKGLQRLLRLFLCGAAGYAGLEMLWRQRTHWTIAHIGERLRGWPLSKRCAAGSVLITTAELIVGATVNLHYHMQVWDYSREKFHFKGQICAKYAALWYVLSAPAMALAARLSDATKKNRRRHLYPAYNAVKLSA